MEDASSNVVETLTTTSCGYCVDHAPDKVIGTVMNNLVVSSQDAAFDKDLLNSLKITHILNVGYNLENAFPQVQICTKSVYIRQLILMNCCHSYMYT
jgi:hypothetical protein